ncbi:MAG: hypothetical protein LBR10_04795 [Prevotellaceae bacterium]|nr:hypothetical protein [Prevotellaceae bacterium]
MKNQVFRSSQKKLMRKAILLLLLAVLAATRVDAGELKDEIAGKWNVVQVETSDSSLNSMITADLSKMIVEFTKSGTVVIADKDTKTKYLVKENTIIFSDGMAVNFSKPETKASIKGKTLTINVSAELVKEIMMMVKDIYLKSGGNAFVAKLIENIAQTSTITGIIRLDRV